MPPSVPPAQALSKARAYALLTELYEDFSAKSFQRKLEKVAETALQQESDFLDFKSFHPRPMLEGRQELAFSVQREVMRRYGFSTDEDGVIAMKTALRALLGDDLIAEKSKAIRYQLRLPQMVFDVVSSAQAEHKVIEDFIVKPDAAHSKLSGHVTSLPTIKPQVSPDTKASYAVKVRHATDKTMEEIVLTISCSNRPRVSDVRQALFQALGEELAKDIKFVVPCAGLLARQLDTDTVPNTCRLHVTDVAWPRAIM